MPKLSKEDRIKDLIRSLDRVKNIRPDEYSDRIALYVDMRNGGTGGEFRSSGVSIRELHFKGWKDVDFQTILEALGETKVLSDDERRKRFPSENQSVWQKLGKMFSFND